MRASREKNNQTYEVEEKILNRIYSLVIYYKESKNPFIKLFRYIRAHFWGLNQIQKKKGKLNGIHLHVIKPAGLIALLFKWFLGLKYTITEHSTAYLKENKNSMSFSEKLLVKITLKNASAVSVVSKQLGKELMELGKISKPELINNVVDETLFKPDFNKSNGIYTFIHISTLTEEHKNPKGLLRAYSTFIKANENSRLIILSDGDLDNCKTYAAELKLEDFIDFIGPKPSSEIAKIIRQCQCLVLFSNYENMPVVISEAWMSGIPVISSQVGGIADNLNEMNGILVKAGDEEALSKAFESMYLNTNGFSKSIIYKQAFEKFSYQAVGETLINFYENNFIS